MLQICYLYTVKNIGLVAFVGKNTPQNKFYGDPEFRASLLFNNFEGAVAQLVRARH